MKTKRVAVTAWIRGFDRPSIAWAAVTRTPKYGDEVYVPAEDGTGEWVNGIVNSTEPERGVPALLIAAPGHAKSNVVLVPLHGYLIDWKWPEDAGRKAVGSKPVALNDVEG